MLPNDYKCDGQMNIFDYLKPYDVGFLRYHISRMDESKAASLKGLTRNEFISKTGGKTACMDVGDLRTGQRFFVTDDAAYRPDVDHVPWDDYIAMFKEVWGEEEKFSWDDDINEIHHRLVEFAQKYNLTISKTEWKIWDHVPYLGYRMWLSIEVKRCELTDTLYEDLDCIVDFAKEKNIELSPTAPVFFDLKDDPNEVAPIYISSMFKDKERQKRKK